MHLRSARRAALATRSRPIRRRRTGGCGRAHDLVGGQRLGRRWIRGHGRRLRGRCRGRGHHRRRRSGLARGQQRQRIDVAVRIVGTPGAELDVRNRGRLGGGDRPDCLALRHAVAGRDRDRPEMCERHRPAVLGPDRHRPTVRRQRAGERHPSRSGRAHLGAGCPGHVDPAMTGRGVRTAAVVEPADDLAGRRPGPRGTRGRYGQSDECQRCCQSGEHGGEASKAFGCCPGRLQRRVIEPLLGHACQAGDGVRRGLSGRAGTHEVGDGLQSLALVHPWLHSGRSDHERDLPLYPFG